LKKVFLLALIILFLLHFDSCKKESIYVCGVEYPEKNLEWLNNMIQGLICEDVYYYVFNNSEYIIISTCNAASEIIESVYSCEGVWLCQHGGKFPGPGCNLSSLFWEEYYTGRKLIYQVRNDP